MEANRGNQTKGNKMNVALLSSSKVVSKMVQRMTSKGYNVNDAHRIVQDSFAMASFAAMLHHLRYYNAISQKNYEEWYDLGQVLDA